MIAIPRNCRDPKASWELLRSLQLTPQAIRARMAHTLILPANQTAWQEAVYDTPDPLFGGQPIGRLYTQLARQLPAQTVSPYSVLVAQALSSVLNSAQGQLEANGSEGLEGFCQGKLLEAQNQLARVLQFANGEKPAVPADGKGSGQ